MPRNLLALSSVALAVSLWSCAAVSPVKNGMDEMQVEARMGKPETVRKNADGSEIWEYPTGPMGRQTTMVTVGSGHAVTDVRQVLSDEYFSQVKAGMSRDQVRQLLGKPAIVSVYGARNEEVWSWRYLQVNPMFFNVSFDRDAGTVRSTQRLDEIMIMDHDC